MAKKPAAHTADTTPPAMDYAQHNATYRGFISLVKGGILSMALLVLALYCFIEAQQPVLGWVLVALMVAAPIAQVVVGGRRSA